MEDSERGYRGHACQEEQLGSDQGDLSLDMQVSYHKSALNLASGLFQTSSIPAPAVASGRGRCTIPEWTWEGATMAWDRAIAEASLEFADAA